MLARLAARLLLAPLGFTLGVTAGFVMLAVITTVDLDEVALLPEDVMLLGFDLSVNAVTVVLLLAPLMAAPAIVAVLIAEMFSIRSWVYYALAGALCALMPWSLAPTGLDGQIFTVSQILAAGVVGGLTHWIIAGRGAGLAELRRSDPPAGDAGPG